MEESPPRKSKYVFDWYEEQRAKWKWYEEKYPFDILGMRAGQAHCAECGRAYQIFTPEQKPVNTYVASRAGVLTQTHNTKLDCEEWKEVLRWYDWCGDRPNGYTRLGDPTGLFALKSAHPEIVQPYVRAFSLSRRTVILDDYGKQETGVVSAKGVILSPVSFVESWWAEAFYSVSTPDAAHFVNEYGLTILRELHEAKQDRDQDRFNAAWAAMVFANAK